MRVWRRCLVLSWAMLIQGCWADFPDSRLHADGSLKQDSTFPKTDRSLLQQDKSVSSVGENKIQVPDAVTYLDTTISDQANSKADVKVCQPNEVISCTDKNLKKCSANGDKIEEINCGAGNCNATLMRCDECDPATPSRCVLLMAVSCSANGTVVKETCANNCVDGKCCKDSDSDSYSTCNGDCDDSNPLVYPGQLVFQTQPTISGKYDYNCDNNEELQYPDLVVCHSNNGVCSGEGWVKIIPKCGVQGTYAYCNKQGGSSNCVSNKEIQLTQGCR